MRSGVAVGTGLRRDETLEVLVTAIFYGENWLPFTLFLVPLVSMARMATELPSPQTFPLVA
jgi:hypothetical protein